MTSPQRNEYAAYVHYLAETELGRYAYRLVKDRADAEDVVKETVTEALRREADFDASTGIDGLKEWVLAICRSQAETYLLSIPGAKLTHTNDPRRNVYRTTEEETDSLVAAGKSQRPSEKTLARTDLTEAADSEADFARRLIRSQQSPKPGTPGTKQKYGTAPKSQAYVARVQQRQADTQDRSRQFFDDLLNNILANQNSTEEVTAEA
jgi:DNA-directed RNA polymerase specialized sigma24 family protein